MSQSQKLATLLKSGKTISVRQASANYGIASPRKIISRLRETGLSILTTKNTAGVTAYKLAA